MFCVFIFWKIVHSIVPHFSFLINHIGYVWFLLFYPSQAIQVVDVWHASGAILGRRDNFDIQHGIYQNTLRLLPVNAEQASVNTTGPELRIFKKCAFFIRVRVCYTFIDLTFEIGYCSNGILKDLVGGATLAGRIVPSCKETDYPVPFTCRIRVWGVWCSIPSAPTTTEAVASSSPSSSPSSPVLTIPDTFSDRDRVRVPRVIIG